LSGKKSNKAIKKVVAAVVQRVPSTYSDGEMVDEPHQTSFFSCLCYELRFGVRHGYTQNSENDFVVIETFSDIVPEARAVPVEPSTVASVDAGTSKAAIADEEASPKFTKDLERTISQSGILLEDPSLIETREAIPDEQEPTPSVTAYYESFGTSFRGELLSVGGQVASEDGGSPMFSLLWKSPKLMGET
jgi:hypothetical protein